MSKRQKPAPPPMCTSCRQLLGWRDTAYGRGGRCKRCTRESENAALRGKPVPGERIPHPTMSYGADKTLAMTKRARQHRLGWQPRAKAVIVPPAKKVPKTRASRRARSRKVKAQVAA